MKKKLIMVNLFFLLAALFFCNGCFYHPKIDRKLEAAKAEYITNIETDGSEYFSVLTEKAIGKKPDNIDIDFRYVTMDFLKADPKTFEEIIDNGYPRLLVGLNRVSGENFTDIEIHDIILEAKNRNLSVDFYFDYVDYRIYQLMDDGVQIDTATAMDGGAYHTLEQYVL